MNEMNCSVAGNSCLFMSDSQKITAKLTIQTFVLSVYFTQLISVLSEKNQMSSYYEKKLFLQLYFLLWCVADHAIAIVDIKLGDDPGLDVLNVLSNARLGIRSLMYSMFDSPGYAMEAIDRGAMGYMTNSV